MYAPVYVIFLITLNEIVFTLHRCSLGLGCEDCFVRCFANESIPVNESFFFFFYSRIDCVSM